MNIIKKVTLGNFKLREELGEDELSKHLSMLLRSATSILRGEAVSSFHDIYRTCDLVCRYGHSRALYGAIHGECVGLIRTEYLSNWREVITKDGCSYVAILAMFATFEGRVKALIDVLSVLDRVYAKKEIGLLRLSVILYGTFRSAIWEPFKDRFVKVGLSLMDTCRDSLNKEFYTAMRSYWEILERLDVFNCDLAVGSIIERTSKYYTSFFVNTFRSSQGTLCEVLKERIASESDLLSIAFPENIQGQLNVCVKKCLISDHLRTFTGDLLADVVGSGDSERCSKLYNLISLVEGHQLMANAFTGIISRLVTDLLKESTQATTIQAIVEFKEHIEQKIISKGLSDDALFVGSFREGLEAALNKQTARISELLAQHLDYILRQPITDNDERRLELTNAMKIFRLLQGKEPFEAFYKQLLATRLLSKSSCSNEMEHLAVNLLKEECGAPFTGRMEGMFRDVYSSRDASSAFQKTPTYRNRKHSFPFSVTIATNGIWPSLEDIDLFIPDQATEDSTLFEGHYLKYAKKKKLKWVHGYGMCIIRAPFTQGPVDLEMPVYIASVFLQFDQSDELDIPDLRKASRLPEKWFLKAIQLLTNHQILSCSAGKDASRIRFNKEAKLPEKLKIHDECMSMTSLASQSAQEKEEETIIMKQQNREERAYRVDAAIIRHLKKHKHSTLSDLQASIGEIDILEERLAALCEREYCKLDFENQNYTYLP